MEKLAKPFGAAQLSDKVREVLVSGRLQSRLLVIDDDPAVRGFLRRVLTGAGYLVAEAGDGKIGMREIERQPINLVITDLVMPEREGLETLQSLRAEHPRVPVISITRAFGGPFPDNAGRFAP